MKTPFKFKHYGFNWSILLVKDIVSDKKNEELLGYIDEHKRVIKLRDDSDHREVTATLLHELLHLVFPKEVVSARTEETIVSQMELPLLHLLEEVGLVNKGFKVTRKRPLAAKLRKPKH